MNSNTDIIIDGGCLSGCSDDLVGFRYSVYKNVGNDTFQAWDAVNSLDYITGN